MNAGTDAAQAARTSIRRFVLPWPLIDWTALLKADNPTRRPSTGRLRQLREKNQVSAGVTVYRRGQRGLQGRATYYSVLSAIAARVRRDGQVGDAERLEQAASELERRFAGRLESFLSRHDLDQLPQADFFGQLTAETAERLSDWGGLPQALLAAAKVEDVQDGVAHLEGSSPRGGPAAVDLPWKLLERQRIRPGDVVWVFSRVIEDAALVELLPAVRIEINPHDAGLELAEAHARVFAPSWLEGPSADTNDGLTAGERSESAARFRATVGGDLTSAEVGDLKAAAAMGRLPRRRLRPAG